MMKLLHFDPLPLLLLLSLLASASSSPCNFPAVFNFGDSNSDTGGLSAAIWPIPPPYGETFFGRPAGRNSDGRLIVDFMAESLGLPFLSAYLDSLGANFRHGANFATASSTIVDQNVSLSQGGWSPFSLAIQNMQFIQFKPRSQLVYNRGGVFRGLMPKEGYFSRALYTFDIGHNDLAAGISGNKPEDEFIPNALAEYSRVIKAIYATGGRNFWIHNTDPLGCLPPFILRVEPDAAVLDAAGCVIRYNEMAQKFNRMLNETVVELRKELPLASFTYVDVYSAKYLLISQAAKYGFERPLAACCGYGGGAFNYDFNVRCGQTGIVDGAEVLLGKSCEDPSKRIIWDGIHYTDAANKWVFDRISGGEFSDPPNPLNMACRKAGTASSALASA